MGFAGISVTSGICYLAWSCIPCKNSCAWFQCDDGCSIWPISPYLPSITNLGVALAEKALSTWLGAKKSPKLWTVEPQLARCILLGHEKPRKTHQTRTHKYVALKTGVVTEADEGAKMIFFLTFAQISTRKGLDFWPANRPAIRNATRFITNSVRMKVLSCPLSTLSGGAPHGSGPRDLRFKRFVDDLVIRLVTSWFFVIDNMQLARNLKANLV